MTVKQFLELASGILGAWLIFNSPANFLIKWTVSPLVAFLGFALAFVPIEDRPLDQWIINFFKAIYQPTQLVFRPSVKQMDFMAPVKISPPKSTDSTPVNPELLEDYLKTLPSAPAGGFDSAEQKYLNYVHSLFGALGTKVTPRVVKESAQPTVPTKSVGGVRVRKLMHPNMQLLPHAVVAQSPPPEPQAAAMPVAQPNPPTKPLTAKTVKATKPVSKIQAANAVPKPVPSTTVSRKTAPPPQLKTAQVTDTVFAKDVIMPQSPEKPNLISGITLDEKGKILPNVILEIKDNKGLPVRALKSNKLGQFFIATPLDDGVYQIEAESTAKRFAIMKLEAKNEIIPPLKIQAQT